MSSKTFLTISKKECLIVYRDILENSDKKWDAGKKLADIEEYGGATSMAIISVEELIKALVVFLDGKGFEFRNVKGMDAIFNHHQIRYFLAYAMFVMSLFGEELLKFIGKVRENPNSIIILSEEIKNDKEFFEKNIKFYLFRKMILIKEEFNWFSKVDIFRKEGFYCDYDDQLKNPIKITKEDYYGVFQRLERVKKIGIALIDSFNIQDEKTTEQFDNIKRDFKQKDYYQKIGDSLATMRKTRQSPFDLIKQSFDKDYN